MRPDSSDVKKVSGIWLRVVRDVENLQEKESASCSLRIHHWHSLFAANIQVNDVTRPRMHFFFDYFIPRRK
jgi:hypothetical protein